MQHLHRRARHLRSKSQHGKRRAAHSGICIVFVILSAGLPIITLGLLLLKEELLMSPIFVSLVVLLLVYALDLGESHLYA